MAYKHFFIEGNVRSERYKIRSRPGSGPNIPSRDRASHSQKLLSQLEAIWSESERLRQQRSAEHIARREGTYLSFTSAANHDLITKSLENLRKGIRLLNIQEISINEDQKQVKATVYVPNGKEGYFIKKIKEYSLEERENGVPKNSTLVNSIEDISIALLESLWTGSNLAMPSEDTKWCEAWLNIDQKNRKEQEQIAQFQETLKNIGIEYKANSIIFPERAVLLINANQVELLELMLQSDLLAEFRGGQEPAGFWVNESSIEQQAWVDDLLERIQLVDSNIKVCLLDSGVNRGHKLLQPLIEDADALTVNSVWGTNDHEQGAGHGTLMAGIVGYGEIEAALASSQSIQLTHKLCSVKTLPPSRLGETPKELWGDITSQAIARAQINNPNINLIYCLSITACEGTNMGRPSSWSGAIDNLAFNDGENQRLIIISAGNTSEDLWGNYPVSNHTSPIQNPAQSWNALVIGAYTTKNQMKDLIYREYSFVAKEGELSPFSTTSLIWESKWPVKPDVVFEGGNLLKSPNNYITQHSDLELLSTSKNISLKPFDTINATSAAAAQASWFASKIAYKYPDAWPETIRGLMVHSAKWDKAMLNQMNVKSGNRSDYRNLIRVFGYGVPDLNRALYSQESALTYVSQETIQPFMLDNENKASTNEIHFFSFPWPSDLLLGLEGTPVTLRITLSYFVEPGAGEIGWKDKYRYQSHGLRFDINNIGESEETFRRRVNIAAREDNESISGNSGSDRWAIGVSNRNNGSVHSDFWEGTAAELATCKHIAIFPVLGWWHQRSHLNKVETRTRYSLIVSLDTPTQDVELYTTVANMIQIPIEIIT